MDVDIDGRVSGLSKGFVSSIRQIQCNVQEVNYFLISGDFNTEPETGKYLADSFLDPLRLKWGEPAEHAPVVSVDGRGDGEVAEAVEDVEAHHLGHLGAVKPALRDVKLRIILLNVDFSLVKKGMYCGPGIKCLEFAGQYLYFSKSIKVRLQFCIHDC